MQIVIDIPEKTYHRIQALVMDDYFEHDICGYSMRRIANGTPLPKGHGRLIDADALIDTLGCSDRDIYVKACIEEDALTIIEADNGENK